MSSLPSVTTGDVILGHGRMSYLPPVTTGDVILDMIREALCRQPSKAYLDLQAYLEEDKDRHKQLMEWSLPSGLQHFFVRIDSVTMRDAAPLQEERVIHGEKAQEEERKGRRGPRMSAAERRAFKKQQEQKKQKQEQEQEPQPASSGLTRAQKKARRKQELDDLQVIASEVLVPEVHPGPPLPKARSVTRPRQIQHKSDQQRRNDRRAKKERQRERRKAERERQSIEQELLRQAPQSPETFLGMMTEARQHMQSGDTTQCAFTAMLALTWVNLSTVDMPGVLEAVNGFFAMCMSKLINTEVGLEDLRVVVGMLVVLLALFRSCDTYLQNETDWTHRYRDRLDRLPEWRRVMAIRIVAMAEEVTPVPQARDMDALLREMSERCRRFVREIIDLLPQDVATALVPAWTMLEKHEHRGMLVVQGDITRAREEELAMTQLLLEETPCLPLARHFLLLDATRRVGMKIHEDRLEMESPDVCLPFARNLYMFQETDNPAQETKNRVLAMLGLCENVKCLTLADTHRSLELVLEAALLQWAPGIERLTLHLRQDQPFGGVKWSELLRMGWLQRLEQLILVMSGDDGRCHPTVLRFLIFSNMRRYVPLLKGVSMQGQWHYLDGAAMLEKLTEAMPGQVKAPLKGGAAESG